MTIIVCKNCHEAYAIGSIDTRQLLLTYCTETCAINDGMSAEEAYKQFKERVPVPVNAEMYLSRKAGENGS